MKLLNSGHYSGGVGLLEETLKLYLREHDLCQRDCEGTAPLSPDVDFYTALSGSCRGELQKRKRRRPPRLTLVHRRLRQRVEV